MKPLGYLFQRLLLVKNRREWNYGGWGDQISSAYRRYVLDLNPIPGMHQEDDPACLASLLAYRSLLPMAEECRKPIFHLTAADGAVGCHAEAVYRAKKDFSEICKKLCKELHLDC